MTWQYWTVSEKRRANAERLTSCLPRLSDLSRILVFGLHQISQILSSTVTRHLPQEAPANYRIPYSYVKSEVKKKLQFGSASACCKAGPSSVLVSAPHGGSSLGERRNDEDTRKTVGREPECSNSQEMTKTE